MKGLFPQYETSRQLDYKAAWKDAIFVFDTNVLLNLYRYQENTRDELLSVLEELSEKIWIPFHVALEFQRNRLKVISEQGKKFSEVRKSIEKIKGAISAEATRLNLAKRHTLIDFDYLTSEFDALAENFLAQLDNSQKTQQKLTDPDFLKERIESLFENRVGPIPSDQKTIDDLFKLAEQRYKFKIPPGYMDNKKDEDSPDEFAHSNIIYKRKYGDYLIWTQLLQFAKENKKNKVIFVTDDAKEDWWLKYNLDGPKTIGPRPELIEEATLTGGINTFIMYNPEGFLQYAKDFLNTDISEATIEDVRDTSEENFFRKSPKQLLANILEAKRVVREWVLSWGGVEIPSDQLDLIVEYNNLKHGYEIRPFMMDESIFPILIKNVIARADAHLQSGVVDSYTLTFALQTPHEVNKIRSALRSHAINGVSPKILLVVGMIDEDGNGFTSYDSGAYNDIINSIL
ncbi:PIN domain-containing protein [Pseudomonas sp. PICF141]|uniref:PIN domain-containing protein n=1 Tax=Pseudomonas sp. PICF141 TaxID=1949067 RepID=UPI000BABF37F|nr:PIN domain-containing protein [Pseudomonas sp. PICF141]PAU53220.1 hypothetical protein BZL43_22340 [Pseudomonas sp. PICF141]